MKLEINVECSINIALRLTPLGNTFFFHSKSRSNSDEASVTLAFRRGVPVQAAKALYPHIRELQSL